MNRLRRWSALAALVLVTALFPALHGQAPLPAEKKEEDKPAEKWLFDRALAVSPAGAFRPAAVRPRVSLRGPSAQPLPRSCRWLR